MLHQDNAYPTSSTNNPDNVEVMPKRRKFSQEEKLRILNEAKQCAHGELGLFLRRTGIYSSTLCKWRKELQEGASLAPKRRGPKPHPAPDLLKELERTKRSLAQSQERVRQCELIIDVQKKVSQMLGITLPTEKP